MLEAMGAAVGALRRFSHHTTEILDAFDRAAGMRETGASYGQIAEAERLFVDFSSGQFKELYDALSKLRRSQARALYAEGMTMAQLGRLLGVTRQRIAVLLGKKATTSDD
ncbi:MAG: sigma-70 family RNA polymerase sigma factor [Acidimicrobiia bacterium]|nr:sigma-70 family RNA polymerase sigma factor [Acidimicrobiia bacterium]